MQSPTTVGALIALVGSSGLEPPTSRLSGVCSNQLSYGPVCGGDERDRTADPLLARQVLSQLSYTPTWVLSFVNCPPKVDSLKIIAQAKSFVNDFKQLFLFIFYFFLGLFLCDYLGWLAFPLYIIISVYII